MKKVLHKLRNQPEHVKSRYVVIFSAVATVVIVGLWITTVQLTKSRAEKVKTESPFAVFGKIFSAAIDDAQTNSGMNSDKEPILPTATDTKTLQNGAVNADTFYDESNPANASSDISVDSPENP